MQWMLELLDSGGMKKHLARSGRDVKGLFIPINGKRHILKDLSIITAQDSELDLYGDIEATFIDGKKCLFSSSDNQRAISTLQYVLTAAMDDIMEKILSF